MELCRLSQLTFLHTIVRGERDLHFTTSTGSLCRQISFGWGFCLINWTSSCDGVRFTCSVCLKCWADWKIYTLARGKVFSWFLYLFWMAIRGQWNELIECEWRELKIEHEWLAALCRSPLCTMLTYVEKNDVSGDLGMSHWLFWLLRFSDVTTCCRVVFDAATLSWIP